MDKEKKLGHFETDGQTGRTVFVGPRREAERLRIGQEIAERRKERGMSQAQLAEQCGLQQSHVARIELGRYSVGLDTLSTIAQALGTTLTFADKKE